MPNQFYYDDVWEIPELSDEDANETDSDYVIKAANRNARCLPCPTCLEENKLTPKDVARGRECETCTDPFESELY